jgi:AraC-like DNA-binding protein
MRWSASLSRSAFRVERDVVVDVSRAFPGTGYRRQDELPLWVKTFALRLEPSMRARQVAWIRRASYMQIGRHPSRTHIGAYCDLDRVVNVTVVKHRCQSELVLRLYSPPCEEWDMTSLRSHRKWITRTTRRAVTIYQVTDRLGDGRTVRVSGDEIAATVSAWLAELGTTSTLAKPCHVSVRTLQEGFQRHLSMSPMAYVRVVRLRRAHRDLRSAHPSHSTVASIAHRWGFTHLGRFAAAHKPTYGQTPLQALRAAR